MEKRRPKRRKNGAPGGWGTCSLNEQAMNSPQSQKLAVRSTVIAYVISATAKTSQPDRMFRRLNDCIPEKLTDLLCK